MAEKVKIALVQMACSSDPEANLQKSVLKIREAASRKAQIVCLPELFRTRYFCQSEDIEGFDLAEPVPGPTTEILRRVAIELGVVLVVPLFEKRAAGIFHNTAAVIDSDGKIAGLYRKMHIPDDPLYYEKFYFTPGDLGFSSHRTAYGEVGVLICWDQWFPEAARLTALQGAGIIFYPTAIGWLAGEKEEENRVQRDAWETVQRGHAIANGVFVAAVNRVGREGKLHFWGSSFLCDPFGRILAKAGMEEEILVAEWDLAALELTRRYWPFLRDRRVDAYQDLGRRFLDKRAPEE